MAKKRTVRAAFDVGQTPTIAVFNKATTPLGVDLEALTRALQRFTDDCVAPVWGTPARLVTTRDFRKDAWAIVFLDDADEANALAYHELTPDGLPVSRVFVRTIQRARESLSVSASHELVEMLVDPAINLWANGPDPDQMWAYETADPVEALSFDVDGFAMTDFVFPSWFEGFRRPRSTQFDWMKKTDRPYQILRDGYQIVWENGRTSEIFGSAAKRRAFAKEDRRLHRSSLREVGGAHECSLTGREVRPKAARR
jgi:hypothetical protein